MSTRKGAFVKVGENLYRYSSSKVYYGVFRRGGKLNWKSLETDDREFAQRRLQELLSKIEKIDPRQRNLSLGELIALYEDGLGKFDVRTQANKRSLVKCLRDTWKHGFEIPVRDVSEAHLSVWLAKQRQRMSRTGYNAYVLFVRQLFDLAVAARAIPDSPAKGFRMEPRESPIRQTPSPDQFEKIVVNVRSQKLNDDAEDSADLIEFMGLAGIGLAECAHLKGEHVDFATHKIWLYRHKTDRAFSIPMFPQLVPFLQRLNENGKLKPGMEVFSVKDPKKALAAACKRLKFPAFTTRSLRRCFITRCVELGIDFKTIAAWQGHSDGGVLIAKTYSHLRNEHSDAMAKKLVAA